MPKDDPKPCKLLDLKLLNGRYYFTWGKGDDWWEKLAKVKHLFNEIGERNFEVETSLWDVPATERSENILMGIFLNGKQVIEGLKSQATFFSLVDGE